MMPSKTNDILSNVWLGVSVENQEWYDKRREDLRDTPAAVHFISYEPALGPLVIPDEDFEWLNWVICSGESGPGAMPMHPEWARNLRDQCVAAGVPFFFRQWGAWFPRDQWEHNPELVLPSENYAYDGTGDDIYRFDDPVDGVCVMHRVGKHKAGRMLDGRTWDEMPETK